MKILNLINLLEYNSSVTLQKWAEKLKEPARRENKSPEEVISAIENIDPTKNKQYMMWLLKQFTSNKFRLEDSERIKLALKNYSNVKNRLPIDQRDIGRFDLHSLEALVDSIYDTELNSSSSNNTDRSIPEDAEVLYNGPLGLLVIPKTQEASCELGRGTKWCTAAQNNNMFSRYTEDGELYIWIDKNGDKYQFHFQTMQFMDAKDVPLSLEQIRSFRSEHPVLKKLFSMAENEIVNKTSHLAFDYFKDVLGGQKFPQGEPAIAKNSHLSYMYAAMTHSRFELGEPSIAKDGQASLYYAINVLKKRFPPGEPMISTHPAYAATYAAKILKGRFPEAEQVIARKGNEIAYTEYASISEECKKAILEILSPAVRQFIEVYSVPESSLPHGTFVTFMRNHLFPEKYNDYVKYYPEMMATLRKAIATDPTDAVFFTQTHLNGERFEEAEEIIAKDTYSAIKYAKISKKHFDAIKKINPNFRMYLW